jgi:hypothetical protein
VRVAGLQGKEVFRRRLLRAPTMYASSDGNFTIG